jgi:hypothetical protein
VVSKRLTGLQLEIPPEDAIVACRAAIRGLEWELAESGETLAAFVPDRGPLSSRHLRASLGVLEEAIRRRIG